MKAPKLPTLFRQNKANQFSFKPRYYDPEKERIAKLRRRYEKENQLEQAPDYVQRKLRRDRLQGMWQGGRQRQVRQSNRTLVLLVILLFFLAYYIITW